MSIKAVKLALEALENASPAAWASRVDSDTMKSIWRKHAEALEGLRVLLAELDNASCKSVQKRLEAQQPVTGEPVYWEWRHLSTHPDTVDFGKWSEWTRVEARSAIHTIEDALAEFRAYIAQGYKYELRALYTPSDA